jgi:hypothetical protein
MQFICPWHSACMQCKHLKVILHGTTENAFWKCTSHHPLTLLECDAACLMLMGYCTAQEHHEAWMHDAMNKLDGEAVEKEVASNVRTMHKTGKAFAQRGLQAYATNCETIKTEIEEFQKVVPLLVVSSCTAWLYWHIC